MPVLDTLHILLWSMNVSKIKDPATDYPTMVYPEKNDWAVDFRLPDFSSFAVRVVPSGAERYTRHRMMPGWCSRFGAWGLALTECIHGWPKGNQGGWSFKSGSQKTWGCLHNHSYSNIHVYPTFAMGFPLKQNYTTNFVGRIDSLPATSLRQTLWIKNQWLSCVKYSKNVANRKKYIKGPLLPIRLHSPSQICFLPLLWQSLDAMQNTRA